MFALLVAGCTHSGLGQSSGGTGDTATTGTSEHHDCPWVGTWTLTDVLCGSFPYDPWFDDHDSATMTIDHDPAGGCAVVTEIASDDCKRTEAWQFSVPVGTSVEVTYAGITDCKPNSCTFSAEEPVCNKGDLADGTKSLTIDDSSGSLNADDLLENTAPSCTIGLRTTWTKN